VRRHEIEPRHDWQQRVAAQGLTFHSVEGRPYWDESAYWEFAASEIDRLEAAGAELQRMCLAAGDHILKHNLFSAMHIPEQAIPRIRETWEREPPALYGRMDLAFDGRRVKLLEYNADTPTSLVEAAVIQWYWLQERFPNRDQFNSIHEKLVAKWRDLRPYVREPVYFGHEDLEEDVLTVAYLRDTAQQAGLRTAAIPIEEIGWWNAERRFVDSGRQPIATLFKLYPWEKLLGEPFGPHALDTMETGPHASAGRTQWIEPIWKMLWSNKALLAILWELFPDHDLLVPAYLDGARALERYVRKPIFGREGANVTLVNGDRKVATPGPYEQGPWVYQALAPVPEVDGNWVVLGLWLVDGEPCGLGVREAKGPIVRNQDRFVPHLF
jgi:glutathionylspermidine synthase